MVDLRVPCRPVHRAWWWASAAAHHCGCPIAVGLLIEGVRDSRDLRSHQFPVADVADHATAGPTAAPAASRRTARSRRRTVAIK